MSDNAYPVKRHAGEGTSHPSCPKVPSLRGLGVWQRLDKKKIFCGSAQRNVRGQKMRKTLSLLQDELQSANRHNPDDDSSRAKSHSPESSSAYDPSSSACSNSHTDCWRRRDQ